MNEETGKVKKWFFPKNTSGIYYDFRVQDFEIKRVA